MDEIKQQLLQELTSVIKETHQGIVSGVAFVQGQIPDLLKQFYAWAYVSNIFELVIGIILAGIAVLAINKGIETTKNDDVACPAWWVLAFITVVPSIVCILDSCYSLLYITFAPKLYLLHSLGVM